MMLSGLEAARLRASRVIAIVALSGACSSNLPPAVSWTSSVETGAQVRAMFLDSVPVGTPVASVDSFLTRMQMNCTQWDSGDRTALIPLPFRYCEVQETHGRRARFDLYLLADGGKLSRVEAFRFVRERDIRAGLVKWDTTDTARANKVTEWTAAFLDSVRPRR